MSATRTEVLGLVQSYLAGAGLTKTLDCFEGEVNDKFPGTLESADDPKLVPDILATLVGCGHLWREHQRDDILPDEEASVQDVSMEDKSMHSGVDQRPESSQVSEHRDVSDCHDACEHTEGGIDYVEDQEAAGEADERDEDREEENDQEMEDLQKRDEAEEVARGVDEDGGISGEDAKEGEDYDDSADSPAENDGLAVLDELGLADSEEEFEEEGYEEELPASEQKEDDNAVLDNKLEEGNDGLTKNSDRARKSTKLEGRNREDVTGERKSSSSKFSDTAKGSTTRKGFTDGPDDKRSGEGNRYPIGNNARNRTKRIEEGGSQRRREFGTGTTISGRNGPTRDSGNRGNVAPREVIVREDRPRGWTRPDDDLDRGMKTFVPRTRVEGKNLSGSGDRPRGIGETRDASRALSPRRVDGRQPAPVDRQKVAGDGRDRGGRLLAPPPPPRGRDVVGDSRTELRRIDEPARRFDGRDARRIDDLQRRDDVPPRRDFVPPRRDDVPLCRDDVPSRRDDVPLRRDDAPPRRDDVPLRRDDVPLRRDNLPLRRDAVPMRRDDMPPRRDDVPQRRDDLLPRRDDVLPRRDDVLPRRDDMLPRRDDVLPRRDDLLPRRDDVLPRRDDLPPRRDELPLRRDDGDSRRMDVRRTEEGPRRLDGAESRRMDEGARLDDRRIDEPRRIDPAHNFDDRRVIEPRRIDDIRIEDTRRVDDIRVDNVRMEDARRMDDRRVGAPPRREDDRRVEDLRRLDDARTAVPLRLENHPVGDRIAGGFSDRVVVREVVPALSDTIPGPPPERGFGRSHWDFSSADSRGPEARVTGGRTPDIRTALSEEGGAFLRGSDARGTSASVLDVREPARDITGKDIVKDGTLRNSLQKVGLRGSGSYFDTPDTPSRDASSHAPRMDAWRDSSSSAVRTVESKMPPMAPREDVLYRGAAWTETHGGLGDIRGGFGGGVAARDTAASARGGEEKLVDNRGVGRDKDSRLDLGMGDSRKRNRDAVGHEDDVQLEARNAHGPASFRQSASLSTVIAAAEDDRRNWDRRGWNEGQHSSMDVLSSSITQRDIGISRGTMVSGGDNGPVDNMHIDSSRTRGIDARLGGNETVAGERYMPQRSVPGSTVHSRLGAVEGFSRDVPNAGYAASHGGATNGTSALNDVDLRHGLRVGLHGPQGLQSASASALQSRQQPYQSAGNSDRAKFTNFGPGKNAAVAEPPKKKGRMEEARGKEPYSVTITGLDRMDKSNDGGGGGRGAMFRGKGRGRGAY